MGRQIRKKGGSLSFAEDEDAEDAEPALARAVPARKAADQRPKAARLSALSFEEPDEGPAMAMNRTRQPGSFGRAAPSKPAGGPSKAGSTQTAAPGAS